MVRVSACQMGMCESEDVSYKEYEVLLTRYAEHSRSEMQNDHPHYGQGRRPHGQLVLGPVLGEWRCVGGHVC